MNLKIQIGLLGIILLVSSSCQNSQIIRDIDGNIYPTVQVNGKLWMAENLRVTRDPSGEKAIYFLPNSDTANIPLYGLLYDFENACKVCPNGWRLPTNNEWEALFDFQGANDARNFKDVGYWEGEEITNSTSFSIRPSGIGNNEEHPNQFQKKVLFWSSDKEEEHFIWTYIFEQESDSIRKASQHPTYAFSVRCVKE